MYIVYVPVGEIHQAIFMWRGVEILGKGLCIKNLDVVEISQMMKTYVAGYPTGYSLCAGQSMFSENYLLHFEEVKDIVPVEYHHHFTDDCKFNGLSGYIPNDYAEHQSNERIVMLLTDEHRQRAFLLLVQESDNSTTIIKDFLST